MSDHILSYTVILHSLVSHGLISSQIGVQMLYQCFCGNSVFTVKVK